MSKKRYKWYLISWNDTTSIKDIIIWWNNVHSFKSGPKCNLTWKTKYLFRQNSWYSFFFYFFIFYESNSWYSLKGCAAISVSTSNYCPQQIRLMPRGSLVRVPNDKAPIHPYVVTKWKCHPMRESTAHNRPNSTRLNCGRLMEIWDVQWEWRGCMHYKGWGYGREVYAVSETN